MSPQKLIEIKALCNHYETEFSFVRTLHHIGLIDLQIVKEEYYISPDQVHDLEKMIRLHQELNVNPEGIDVVFNLLEREKNLRDELIRLRNRLEGFEEMF